MAACCCLRDHCDCGSVNQSIWVTPEDSGSMYLSLADLLLVVIFGNVCTMTTWPLKKITCIEQFWGNQSLVHYIHLCNPLCVKNETWKASSFVCVCVCQGGVGHCMQNSGGIILRCHYVKCLQQGPSHGIKCFSAKYLCDDFGNSWDFLALLQGPFGPCGPKVAKRVPGASWPGVQKALNGIENASRSIVFQLVWLFFDSVSDSCSHFGPEGPDSPL